MKELYTYIEEGLLTSKGSVADQMASSEEAMAPELIEEWVRKHDPSETRHPVIDVENRKATLDCALVLDEKCLVSGVSFDGKIHTLILKKDDKDLIDWWNGCSQGVVIEKIGVEFPSHTLRSHLNLNMSCFGVIAGGGGHAANKDSYIKVEKGMDITLHDDNASGPVFSTFSIYLSDLDDIRKITFGYPPKRGSYYCDILDLNLWVPYLSSQQRDSIIEMISSGNSYTSDQMQEIFGAENIRYLEKLVSDKIFRAKSMIYISGFPRSGRVGLSYSKGSGSWTLHSMRNMKI